MNDKSLMDDMISEAELKRALGVDSLQGMAGDFSPRKYYRGSKDNRNFVAMVYPRGGAENLGDIDSFVQVGDWLAGQGIKVAELYDRNEHDNYAVFEDLGHTSFGAHLRAHPEDREKLYMLATDVLKKIAAAKKLPDIHKFRFMWKHQKHDRVIKFYRTMITGQKPDNQLLKSYWGTWGEIEQQLPPCPQIFVHVDYHPENMMYRPDDNGLNQCALIDYQDSAIGPAPYDLVNLLRDARITVPDDIQEKCINHYCAEMDASEKDTFIQWFHVLATQFHCRVIGQFIKISVEMGRDDYLVHIPRLQNYIKSALKDPLLAPIKNWFSKEGVDFAPINDLDGHQIRKVFQNTSSSNEN